MKQSMFRLGVDIGGTFTDVVLETGTGLFSVKILTSHSVPEDAILEGLNKVCALANVSPGRIGQVIHGTTLATNALIERRGARTALITTEGFRDVIEIRHENRFEQYDLNLELPEPLLPRQQRYTVRERISAGGEILISLQRAEVETLVEELKLANFESIAVGLLHSYLNDQHEKLVRDVVRAHLPEVSVSLSSEVSPQMREYERFNTVVANAYIKPMMESYLSRLRERLRAAGTNCPIFLMHSGGGLISIENAVRFPVRLIESGPAGGAVFAADIATRYGLDKVLSFDMGGTTAKICLIDQQSPKTCRVFEAARSYRFKKGSGMPISIPVIDMVEIGAGGGSLASVDDMFQIRVGPESAGSEPGPACYGRGGNHPTVTDADLLLGRLDPGNFANGSISLDTGNAERVLHEDIGRHLQMDPQTAAFGLSEVVDENMANAARVHAVENGEDISEYTMIAFGGAAPLHAARLCEKLGVKRCLVPPGAGVGSAIGFLRAPFSFEASRSFYMRLSGFDRVRVQRLFGELQSDALGFVQSCNPDAAVRLVLRTYMRYQGQGEEIPVELTSEQALSPKADTYRQSFEATYANLFGRVVTGMDIEFTVWSVSASTVPDAVDRIREVENKVPLDAESALRLFDPALGCSVESSLVSRSTLKQGHYIVGPAAITEEETTIVLSSSRAAVCQSDGCIDIVQHTAHTPP